jgi:hypothetical protein
MPEQSDEPIRITLDDVAKVELPDVATRGAVVVAAGDRGGWGNIIADAAPGALKEEKGSVLLQGWFYLGAAGLLGALIGWGICEPWFVDGQGQTWANWLLTPLIVMLISIGFGAAESIAERSPRKALFRGGISIPLGLALGFFIFMIANVVYGIGMMLAAGFGAQSISNPAFWIVRAIAWAVFGVAGGAVYGIVGLSGKKAAYGILGGAIGAFLGGLLFDPIALGVKNGVVSRGVGFALVGAATGIAMGLVESAMKDRWLYVCSGPLAGKQFILYKPMTAIGSAQQSDIYLFKDSSVLPQHAILEAHGPRLQLRGFGPVFVGGQPTQLRVLQSGDMIQIGRYGFRYQERQRSK